MFHFFQSFRVAFTFHFFGVDIFLVNLLNIEFLSCFAFSVLFSFYILLFPCPTFFVLDCFHVFMFSILLMLYFLCATLFILHLLRVASFSCCTVMCEHFWNMFSVKNVGVVGFSSCVV